MARPVKKGLDYFPVDTNFDDDLELIKAEFSYKGLGIFITLLQKIYGGYGYYMKWDEDVELLLNRAGGLEFGGNSVSELIDGCIRRGIFNKELFEKYSILTSKGIQSRYIEAVLRRKEITMIKEYVLLNGLIKEVNDDINLVNVYINSINDNNNPQSKVKESKLNKKKENIYLVLDSFNLDLSVKGKLKEYIDMRKSIKSPMTDNAVRILIGNLNKLSSSNEEQIEILDQSIVSNWKSVYPLKNKQVKSLDIYQKRESYVEQESTLSNEEEKKLRESLGERLSKMGEYNKNKI